MQQAIDVELINTRKIKIRLAPQGIEVVTGAPKTSGHRIRAMGIKGALRPASPAIESPVLNRLRHVGRGKRSCSVEIGNRARDLEHAVVTARR